MQPKPEDYRFDLDMALAAMVGIKTTVPDDAFTAETLGTERAGHGVLIGDKGHILTIGYLVTEAEKVWLSLSGGRVLEGHVLGYDQATGFGLIQALGRVDLPGLELGSSSDVELGSRVVVAGFGGRAKSVAARIIARQEFAGYWEYLVDQALFTAPAHPNWGGTGVIGPDGTLVGIGSLQIQRVLGNKQNEDINMIVPIDLLKPILDDLKTVGKSLLPPRPWLGLFATEVGNRVAVAGLSSRGPAAQVDIRRGDVVLAVAGDEVHDLAGFFRRVWALGKAGVHVPLLVHREGRTFEVSIPSGDRSSYLKGPVLH